MCGKTEQFAGAARIPRLQQNGDDRHRFGHRPTHCKGCLGLLVAEDPAGLQQGHRLRYLALRRAAQHAAVPLDLHDPGFTHPGRTSVSAPGAVTQIHARDRAYFLRRHEGLFGVIHLRRPAETFGCRQHGRQRHLGLDPRVVVLAADVQRAVLPEFQASYRRNERQTQQLSQFRPHLSRIGVYRILADQDDVERPFSLKNPGQRLRGGKGVRTGECGIGNQDAIVRTGGHPPANYVLRRRRSQGDYGALSGGRLRQFDALAEGALAIRVHGQFDAIALQSAIRPERHGFKLRYLLYECCDAQGLHDHFLTSGVVETCAASFRFSWSSIRHASRW